MQLKILWVNAIDYRFEVETRYQPLGVFFMMAELKGRFPSHSLEFRLADRRIRSELERFRPDLVAISCVSQNYNVAKRYARLAKASGSAVVIGGVHISALPMTLTADMDVGVLGEGEVTFGDLVELYLEKGQLAPPHLKDIAGVVYWANGILQYSNARQPITDLDSLPHPDRTIMNDLTKPNLLSSRGCPFRCTFCFSSHHWGRVRLFSPEYVCEEIQLALEGARGRTTITFWDDLFTANFRRLERIYELLGESKLLGDFRFACSARSSTLNEDTVRLLREMGCASVGMGLESGNEEILRYLKGDRISLSDHIRAIELLRKYDIEVAGSFVIGSPHETKAQIMDTWNFIRENQLDIFDVYLLTPFPGTPVWEYAEERGMVSTDMDWSVLNLRFADAPKRAIILSERLDRKQLVQLFRSFKRLRWKRLFRTVWKSPHLWKLPGITWGLLKERAVRLFSSSPVS